jgi:hypothetical protein
LLVVIFLRGFGFQFPFQNPPGEPEVIIAAHQLDRDDQHEKSDGRRHAGNVRDPGSGDEDTRHEKKRTEGPLADGVHDLIH